MSSTENTKVFVCSYCEQKLKFNSRQEGKLRSCPKCNKTVRIYANQHDSIVEKLSSVWYYKQPRRLSFLGSLDVGPISDTEFLQLVQQGEIDGETSVRCPELTRNQFVLGSQVNVQFVSAMIRQRDAEVQRVSNLATKEATRQSQNRETLRRGIKQAIADGSITHNERTQLDAFASKTGIPSQVLNEYLRSESANMLQQEIEDTLADGIFDDRDAKRISQLAIGLGLTSEFTKEQEFRISLARHAWRLTTLGTSNAIDDATKTCNVELFEVVSLKRPIGIPLGDDHYLKSVGTGDVELGQNHLLFNGKFASKKYAVNTISHVDWYSDGLFCKRTSGKSLFLQPEKLGLKWYEFAMFFQFQFTGEPVLGILPTDSFIPVQNEIVSRNNVFTSSPFADETDDDTAGNDNWQPSKLQPRFTFRVVGENYENRHQYLVQLRRGDTVYLRREPENRYDSNAVAVTNTAGNILGYLKREVSEWFAAILDRGKKFRCEVFDKRSSGGILVALYE